MSAYGSWTFSDEDMKVWETDYRNYQTVTVIQKCGHKFSYTDISTNLPRSILFFSNRFCEQCWKTLKKNDKIAIAQILNLPVLKGSFKQYVSAMYLRSEFAIKLIDEIELTDVDIKPFLSSQHSAAWWLENKCNLMEKFQAFAKTSRCQDGQHSELHEICSVLTNMYYLLYGLTKRIFQ